MSTDTLDDWNRRMQEEYDRTAIDTTRAAYRKAHNCTLTPWDESATEEERQEAQALTTQAATPAHTVTTTILHGRGIQVDQGYADQPTAVRLHTVYNTVNLTETEASQLAAMLAPDLLRQVEWAESVIEAYVYAGNEDLEPHLRTIEHHRQLRKAIEQQGRE